MADVGYAGRWEPMVVGSGTLNELRDLAGEPIHELDAKGNPKKFPEQWVRVSLRSGEFQYP